MGTLICRVELNKTKGLILTVDDKDGKITQTATLNGESITLESKGQDDTSSTIVQKPDSITINCKTFILESETITCKSTKDTLLESESKFDIKSSKDMTLDCGAKLAGSATGDMEMSGQKVAVSAKGDAELTGLNIKVEGKVKTDINAKQLALAGTIKVEMEGGMTKVSSKGMLDVESTGITTVKGSMLKLEGPLLKVG
jgi:hypothetical protein